MRKILILAAVCMAAVVTGCGSNRVDNSVSDTNIAVTLPLTSEERPVYDVYSIYAGSYQDEYSQRAMATVSVNSDSNSANVYIRWANSAFSYTDWEMNVVQDGDRLVYSDCVQKNHSVPDGGKETVETVYTGKSGYFEWQDNTLKWTGAYDENCRNCRFVKVQK